MRCSDRCRLYGVCAKRWVAETAKKMHEASTETKAQWKEFWLKTYRDLQGQSDSTGSKGCPKAAAYGLWYLGWLHECGRIRQSWDVVQVDKKLGKNAAYAVIAARLLADTGQNSAKDLWPLVQARYARETGKTPARSEQGEIRLVIALFGDQQ